MLFQPVQHILLDLVPHGLVEHLMASSGVQVKLHVPAARLLEHAVHLPHPFSHAAHRSWSPEKKRMGVLGSMRERFSFRAMNCRPPIMSWNMAAVEGDWHRGSPGTRPPWQGRWRSSRPRAVGAEFPVVGPRDREFTRGLTPCSPRRRRSAAASSLPRATRGALSCPVPERMAPSTSPG